MKINALKLGKSHYKFRYTPLKLLGSLPVELPSGMTQVLLWYLSKRNENSKIAEVVKFTPAEKIPQLGMTNDCHSKSTERSHYRTLALEAARKGKNNNDNEIIEMGEE
jgi:hypothetical protein